MVDEGHCFNHPNQSLRRRPPDGNGVTHCVKIGGDAPEDWRWLSCSSRGEVVDESQCFINPTASSLDADDHQTATVSIDKFDFRHNLCRDRCVLQVRELPQVVFVRGSDRTHHKGLHLGFQGCEIGDQSLRATNMPYPRGVHQHLITQRTNMSNRHSTNSTHTADIRHTAHTAHTAQHTQHITHNTTQNTDHTTTQFYPTTPVSLLPSHDRTRTNAHTRDPTCFAVAMASRN